MKYESMAARAAVASAVLLIFGVGCGSAGGGGACGGLKPLPTANGQPAPAPLGLPTDQVIEGGIQARITKPGMDKLLAAVSGIFGNNLKNGICLPAVNKNFGITCFNVDVGMCNKSSCNSAPGCQLQVLLSSPDGKNQITASISEGNNPVVHVDAKFDLHIPLELDYGGTLFCASASGSCTMNIDSSHYGDASKNPLEIVADIQTGIDPATGELTLTLANLSLANLDMNVNGCSVLGNILNSVLGFLNSTVGNAITNFVINLIKPQLNSLLQSFLPKPPGVAGVFSAGTMLKKFGAPPDANLEMFVVAGGYVKGHSGGLNLGVISGVNSDRDESTRQPGLTSEPSLCVPVRPTPQLAQAPWMLPYNAARKDYLLSPANEFSGMPDPTDSMGNVQDVAIGLSRTFLDLFGFHAYNSGTLCLNVGGAALPQLNAGTLSVIIGSLGNVIENRKAPLELVLRPQTPLTFTVGVGDMTDPLIHVGINDMRIDFYAWVEERFVRLMTVALDMNVGINLTITKDANMHPAVQPMLLGVDAKNVTIRVSNTDLLAEKPDALAQVFPSLINIATSALGGGLKPIALPAVAGFSLDNLKIQRVQTSQDDFVAIFGTIVKAPTMKPFFRAAMSELDGNGPQVVAAGALRTLASVGNIATPPAEQLQALFAPRLGVVAARPTVQLQLDADGAEGRDVEFAWRVDGGFWRVWTRDHSPTLHDDAFLLQGHHTVEVRSRVVGDWTTESEPVALDVLIDSVAPELHPAMDDGNDAQFKFGGFDIVSDASQLQYAWLGLDGKVTAWTSNDTMTYADAARLTDGGKRRVILYVKDEAGNVGQGAYDMTALGFHGRTTAPSASGCGCTVGGADDRDENAARAGIFALALVALVLLRRRARKLAPIAIALVATFGVSGCGCQNHGNCKIDDDCAKMMCPAGQVPACNVNMCGCNPDILLGDIGRFSSQTLLNGNSYVSAYNNTYGDLMIGHVAPPGVVGNWDFVDGVPDVPPDVPNSHVRGGIMEKGDDVGRYTSIATNANAEPIIAYYDVTHGALKFASFGAIRWHTHTVDVGTGKPEGGGDVIGKWTSLSVGSDGKPAIAYSAWVQKGPSGMRESQLRWAQANTTTPQAASDWTITVVDSRLASDNGAPPTDMGAPDMAVGPDMANGDAGAPPGMPEELLPEGIAIMASVARKPDGSPGISYYDRTRGNLRLVEWNSSTMKWGTPQILDGEKPDGTDTGDVGLYNSLTYDGNSVAHVSYENATLDRLLYVNTSTKMVEVIDDGYHPKDEQTKDGIDSPVWHLVGDSSSIQFSAGKLVVAYQDSTVLMLRLAVRGANGTWTKQYVAGHATPYAGSYGFYANLKMQSGSGVVSSYAINQQNTSLGSPFYVEVFAVDISSIQ